MQLHTPRRLMPMTRSHSSRLLSATGVSHHARVVECGIEASELGDGAVHHARHVSVSTDVAADRERFVTCADERFRFSPHRTFVDVRQDDGCARFCERLRGRQPHAGCSSGDKGHFAGEVQWMGHVEYLVRAAIASGVSSGCKCVRWRTRVSRHAASLSRDLDAPGCVFLSN
jgi:hypothetical protein